jgi:hypothetical protein
MKEINKMSIKSSLTLGLLATALLLGSNIGTAHAAPTCVNNFFSGMNGLYRDYKLVRHKKANNWVSYSEGKFYKSSSVAYAIAGNSATMNTRFSDRYADDGMQNFDWRDGDVLELTLYTSGKLVITDRTWLYTTTLNTATCSGNLIMWSDSDRYYTLSFGSAYTPIE